MHAALPDRDAHRTAATPVLAERFSDNVLRAAPLGRIGTLEVRLARNPAERPTLEELFAAADFLTVHLPKTKASTSKAVEVKVQ